MSKENFEVILNDIQRSLSGVGHKSEWDMYVPIISEGNNHTVYLTDPITEPSYYNRLTHKLYSANDYDTFTFVINNGGGILDSAFMVTDAIKASKAKEVCHIVGTVASAATIIVMVCDELVTTSNVSFMIHNYSAGMQGKGHEMKARQKFIDAELERAFTEFYLGFLTKDEIQDVIDGKDFWMNAKEVEDRWERKQSLL